MNAINEEKEIENFEKSLKPIKHFDGDIPMEELMNLKFAFIFLLILKRFFQGKR